jgi:hypothetical protein
MLLQARKWNSETWGVLSWPFFWNLKVDGNFVQKNKAMKHELIIIQILQEPKFHTQTKRRANWIWNNQLQSVWVSLQKVCKPAGELQVRGVLTQKAVIFCDSGAEILWFHLRAAVLFGACGGCRSRPPVVRYYIA